MTNYASVQKIIDRGKGLAARTIGQPYNVYRVGASSNGDVIQSGNQIATNYAVYRERLKGGDPGFETDTTQGTFWFSMWAMLGQFQVGDIFQLVDPVYGAGYTQVSYSTNEINAMCLAAESPEKTTIGARIDNLIQVYRPNLAPDSTGYFKQTLDNALPIVCTNGVFAPGIVGQTASFIPAGFMPIPRPRGGGLYDATPNIMPHTIWRLYVMPLPGFRFMEGDKIIAQTDARYTVMNPYYQETGISGNQLIIEREVAGSAGG